MDLSLDNIAEIAVCITTVIIAKLRKSHRCRTIWSKKWHQRRNAGCGIPHMLNNELLQEDPAAYRFFLRLQPIQFEELLVLVAPHLSKQDTIMRQCISARNR